MSFFALNWQFNWASRYLNTELLPKEHDRLRALVLWQETNDIKLACRTFGLSRPTLYRWLKCFDSNNLAFLRDRSRKPHRL